MIQHVVLFKRKPGIAADDARLAALEQQMAELPKQIAVIKAWHFGRNLTADAEAWDYGLYATFATLDDLHAYFEHPAHLPVLERWYEVATLAFADFSS